jgi:hypothetical protein
MCWHCLLLLLLLLLPLHVVDSICLGARPFFGIRVISSCVFCWCLAELHCACGVELEAMFHIQHMAACRLVQSMFCSAGALACLALHHQQP